MAEISVTVFPRACMRSECEIAQNSLLSRLAATLAGARHTRRRGDVINETTGMDRSEACITSSVNPICRFAILAATFPVPFDPILGKFWCDHWRTAHRYAGYGDVAPILTRIGELSCL